MIFLAYLYMILGLIILSGVAICVIMFLVMVFFGYEPDDKIGEDNDDN